MGFYLVLKDGSIVPEEEIRDIRNSIIDLLGERDRYGAWVGSDAICEIACSLEDSMHRFSSPSVAVLAPFGFLTRQGFLDPRMREIILKANLIVLAKTRILIHPPSA